jgi:phage terminase large subunit
MNSIKNYHQKFDKFPTIAIPLGYVGTGINRKVKKLKIDTKEFFNEAFVPAVADRTAIQIYFGGAGSSKSVTIAKRTILDMLAGQRNFLIVRKVYGNLKDSFYNELKKAANANGVSEYFTFKKSPLEIVCRNGKMAVFRGLDDPEKIKSITVEDGIITDIIIEETTELTEPDYELLDTRLRGECDVPKRTTILFNPIHKGHWLYERFFEGRFPEDAKEVRYDEEIEFYNPLTEQMETGVQSVLIHKSNHWDNRFLTDKDRIKYEGYKNSNPHMYNVYTLGNWGVLGDIIFPNIEVRDLTGVAKQMHQLYDGLDFGFAPDPSAVVTVGIKGKCIYVFQEETGRKQRYSEIIDMVKRNCGGRSVYADTNEPRTLLEMEEAGIDVHPVRKWKGNNQTAIMYCQGFTFVVDYRCKVLLAQLQSYSYQKDKNGKSIDKPNESERTSDGHHDVIQAVFYALNEQINGSRNVVMK